VIDPPPLIGPATPLRRVERTPRDGDPGRRHGEQAPNQRKRDENEHEHEHEGDEGLHVDVRV
jgi:hypothetical protein